MRALTCIALLFAAGCGEPDKDCTAPPADDTGPMDADGDGHPARDDCDDADPAVFPGADERCNGWDDDCDGLVDDADDVVVEAPTWYVDNDGDGYGSEHQDEIACEAPEGFVDNDADCDDRDPDDHPGADEVCGGNDNDCDGLEDDEDPDVVDAPTWYEDADGDGYADASSSVVACDPGEGWLDVDAVGDCDDTDAGVNPDALDVCGNGIDEDCSGADKDCPEATVLMASDATATMQDCGTYDRIGGGWGLGDLDGDGRDDVGMSCVGDNSYVLPGSVHAFFGPVSGSESEYSADASFVGDGWTETWIQLATTGDWDGDGARDLAFLVDYDNTLRLFAGPVAGSWAFDDADVELSGFSAGALPGVPDQDGDGADELLVGGGGSTAWLFHGPVTSGTTGDAEVVLSSGSSGLGVSVSAGDTDGDGIDDLVLGATGGGRAYLVLGPLSADLDLDADAVVITGSYGAGGFVSLSGDADGDGLADLLVEDESLGSMPRLVLGPVTASGDMATLAHTSFDDGTVVTELDGPGGFVGDVDGDGCDDVLLSDPDADITVVGQGAALLFLAPARGGIVLDSAADVIIHGDASDDAMEACVDPAAGDTDGDGLDDLLLCKPGWDSSYGDHEQGFALLFVAADL